MSTCKWHKPFIVLLIFLFSCGKALPTFDDINLQAWKDDKKACQGSRTSMMKAMETQSNKLLALSEQEIISLLGKPDENELYKRNQKFYYYFVQPAATCTNAAIANPKKLVIRFNAVGLAREVAME